jgi:N-acetyl-gamma-glutamyl-phosphate reductase
VTGSNVCELGVELDGHAGTAVVLGAVDNLGKGAAGQAIQNLNVMLGFQETAGLSTVGMWP